MSSKPLAFQSTLTRWAIGFTIAFTIVLARRFFNLEELSTPHQVIEVAFYWVIATFAVDAFLLDLREQLVEVSKITLLAILALAYGIIRTIFLHSPSPGQEIASLVWGGAIGGGFPALLVIASRERAMGQGDIYLGLLMGSLLGFPNIVLGWFLAIVAGAVIGIILRLAKRNKPFEPIPLGPFLLGSIPIIMIWGKIILNWYLKLAKI